jgi:acyl-[acyl-carrier-protein]-phospholipid O-acyltransferase / long-chain-fatty-acid--[acyl-carrier-protein] ligase
MNMFHREQTEITLAHRFLRMCRRNLRRSKVSDSSGIDLTGADLLVRTWILRRVLRRRVLCDEEEYMAVLLPPSVAAVVANAALSLDLRIAVNLNYTASAEVMNACIGQCGIRHVLTSRRVIERLQIKLDADLIYLEDLKDEVTWFDKLIASGATWLFPVPLLVSWLGLDHAKPDDVLTVIFTSGTTGRPKGVMLTHRNVGSNIDALDQVLGLRPTDVLLAILPFFHSFGYTGTLWTVLTLDPKGVYHHSPLEPRPIGQLSRKHGATILVATPTFLRCYLRRCQPEDFAAMEVVFVGAEKLPEDLVDAFEQRFGVRPCEGYGATELSPMTAGNIPPSRGPGALRQGYRPGTVGRPLPGIKVKIVDLETCQDLGPGQAGMLMVKGPNVMKGYLDQPTLSAEVIRNGWYVTGDVAEIDADGFIRITDRLSRFSKIGGEMVPHLRVEETLVRIVGGEGEHPRIAVTSVPDPKKGERLVVLHTDLGKPVDDVCRELREAGLPALWIPSPASFCHVDKLPVLGTGKLDLKGIRQLALAEYGIDV